MPGHTPRSILLTVTVVLLIVVVSLPAPASSAAAGRKVHNGDLVVTRSGTVIENLEIRGQLKIQASNVTVRNVWVWGYPWALVKVESGSLTIEDSELGKAGHTSQVGIAGSNITGRRLDIHHTEDGVGLGSNSVYDRIHVHDLDRDKADPHADAVQVAGPASNSVVKNSTLSSTGPLGLGNAAVIVKPTFGKISNITFSNNSMDGGNYTVFVRRGRHGLPSNITFSGNRFGRNYRYGILSSDGGVNWTGNVWADTGKPVVPNSSGTRFSDVSGNNLFAGDIEWLADAGISRGCNPPANTRFCPTSTVTRGQMAAFLTRALQLPAAKRDHFTDDNDSIFENDINRAADAGIARGCNPPANTRFCPDSAVRRGQMAAFLVRAKGYTDNGGGNLFIDDNGLIYEADIDRLGTAGVTKGCNPPTNNRFCPHDKVTRAQMAAFLHRAFG